MSIAALKEEAIRQFAVKVESIEDEASLMVVIDFLSGIKGDDKQAINLSRHYSTIKEKYGSVLKKLAE
jgi:hypothetical protein